MAEKISFRWILLFGILLLFGLSALGGEKEKSVVKGLVTLKSDQPMPQTLADLQQAISRKGLTLFTIIDHAANAEKSGLTLPPTKVVVFGNPELGTSLMQASRTMAIDLPQKMLLWEDGEGRVWLAYNDPSYLARRHVITDQDKVIERIGSTLEELARSAAEGERP